MTEAAGRETDRDAWGRRCRTVAMLGCAGLGAGLVMRIYLGTFTWLLAMFVVGAATLSALVSLLLWLVVRPSRRKLHVALPAFLTLALTLPLLPVLQRVDWPLFMWPRRQQLDSFVEDFLAYGRIHAMDDARRFRKWVNGIEFDASDRSLEVLPLSQLAEVLEAESIDPERYEEFRRRLIRTGVISVERTEGFVGFVLDGMLDNLHGVLWVRPGLDPPPLGSRVFHCDLVGLRDLGDGWFAFGTT